MRGTCSSKNKGVKLSFHTQAHYAMFVQIHSLYSTCRNVFRQTPFMLTSGACIDSTETVSHNVRSQDPPAFFEREKAIDILVAFSFGLATERLLLPNITSLKAKGSTYHSLPGR